MSLNKQLFSIPNTERTFIIASKVTINDITRLIACVSIIQISSQYLPEGQSSGASANAITLMSDKEMSPFACC